MWNNFTVWDPFSSSATAHSNSEKRTRCPTRTSWWWRDPCGNLFNALLICEPSKVSWKHLSAGASLHSHVNPSLTWPITASKLRCTSSHTQVGHWHFAQQRTHSQGILPPVPLNHVWLFGRMENLYPTLNSFNNRPNSYPNSTASKERTVKNKKAKQLTRDRGRKSPKCCYQTSSLQQISARQQLQRSHASQCEGLTGSIGHINHPTVTRFTSSATLKSWIQSCFHCAMEKIRRKPPPRSLVTNIEGKNYQKVT